MKKCSSCRNGENDVEATHYAEGSRISPSRYSDKRVPYRAYLCEHHLVVELDECDFVGRVTLLKKTKGGK